MTVTAVAEAASTAVIRPGDRRLHEMLVAADVADATAMRSHQSAISVVVKSLGILPRIVD